MDALTLIAKLIINPFSVFTLWQKLAEFLVKLRPLESVQEENIPLNLSRRDSKREKFF